MSISINKENTPIKSAAKSAVLGTIAGGTVAAGITLKPLAVDSFKKSTIKQSSAIEALQKEFKTSGFETVGEFVADKKDLLKTAANYDNASSSAVQIFKNGEYIKKYTLKYASGEITDETLSKLLSKKACNHVKELAQKVKSMPKGTDKKVIDDFIKEEANAYKKAQNASLKGLYEKLCGKGLKGALKDADKEGRILVKGDKAQASKLTAAKDTAIEIGSKAKNVAKEFLTSENKLEYLKANPNKLQALKRAGKFALVSAAGLMTLSVIKNAILKPKSKN